MNNILYRWPSYHHNSFLRHHPRILGVCVKRRIKEYLYSIPIMINHRNKTAIAYNIILIGRLCECEYCMALIPAIIQFYTLTLGESATKIHGDRFISFTHSSIGLNRIERQQNRIPKARSFGFAFHSLRCAPPRRIHASPVFVDNCSN